MGLLVRIWALRLRFGPQGWNLSLKASKGVDGEEGGEGEEEREISQMCESIGHRPLWGRCPKSKRFKSQTKFLIAKRNYTLLCWSVGLSIGPSVIVILRIFIAFFCL